MPTRALTAAALCLFLPLHLVAARADDAPEVKTGVRVVASISLLPGGPPGQIPAARPL